MYHVVLVRPPSRTCYMWPAGADPCGKSL